LDAARLGGIFGRDQTVHVGLAGGRLAGMIEMEATRLAGVTASPAIANAGESGQRDPRDGVATGGVTD
ncbi:MAG TPA: DUF448 domain-containing protein, partial [Acetobacteraceae bacterium]|nr:DUF448 domain-containing protein [Acetobacteraceae bacterium]